jgi:hypothetical protein
MGAFSGIDCSYESFPDEMEPIEIGDPINPFVRCREIE